MTNSKTAHSKTAHPKTTGQAEREINQRLRSLYKKQLGHKVSDVTCQLFDTKLAIVLENAVTKVEKKLLEDGKETLTAQVHEDLSGAIESHIKEVVESTLDVSVIDVLDDTELSSGRTGMIVVLSESPALRSARKHKAHATRS